MIRKLLTHKTCNAFGLYLSIVVNFLINTTAISETTTFANYTSSANVKDFTCIKNVVYGSSVTQNGLKQVLEMDIYLPDTAVYSDLRPVVLFAHGGYFYFGDKAGFSEECEYFAARGFVAATINYRLIDVEETDMASKIAVIDAVHDFRAAVRFFNKSHAEGDTYKINPKQVFIGGYSAGAVTSLHYAYANTTKDVFEMGGKELLAYVLANGMLEGASGNPGYSSEIHGVINIAGSIHSANLIDENEPPILSIQGDKDEVVPFNSGTTGRTDVITEGAGLIHKRATDIGLKSKLIQLKGGSHLARFKCDNCIEEMYKFLADIRN